MDDREQLSILERIRSAAGRFKYALAAVLAGVLLLILPTGTSRKADSEQTAQEPYPAVQSEMERVLSAFDGVGRLRLMLTVVPGTERWAGAVIVCEGGDNAAVRLQLTRAVSSLTGLSSDKITVVKGKP